MKEVERIKGVGLAQVISKGFFEELLFEQRSEWDEWAVLDRRMF